MQITKSRKFTSVAFRERHTFLQGLLETTKNSQNWRKSTLKSQVVEIPANVFDTLPEGTLVALVARKNDPLLEQFAEAIKSENNMLLEQTLNQVADRIEAASDRMDDILEQELNSIVSIKYNQTPVISNVILDPVLEFNFFTVDFYNGNPNATQIKVIENWRNGQSDYQAIVGIVPRTLNKIEAAAMKLAPMDEKDVLLNFKVPHANLLKDIAHGFHKIEHTVADTVEKTVRVAAQTTKVLVDDGTAEDVGRVGIMNDSLNIKHELLLSTENEGSVDELIDLRKSLLDNKR